MMRCVGAVCLLGLLAGARGAQVVVFGDSWATGARTAFTDMFDNHGANVTVDNRGVGGTFAEGWAETPNALRDAVSANPDATHVWLSLGGNDGILRLATGQRPISEITEVTVGFLRVILDPLFEAHPHIQLLVFGYEIIDLGGLVCGLMGLVLLPECSGSIACINGGPGMEPRGTYALQDAANELQNLYPTNVVSIDLRGSMQEASGTVAPPFPNLDSFTPTALMGDCIHPNYNGYSALLERSWQIYWSRYFPGSATPTRNATAMAMRAASEDGAREGSLVQPLDEAEYRRQAARLGIGPQKIEQVVAWHRNHTQSLLH